MSQREIELNRLKIEHEAVEARLRSDAKFYMDISNAKTDEIHRLEAEISNLREALGYMIGVAREKVPHMLRDSFDSIYSEETRLSKGEEVTG